MTAPLIGSHVESEDPLAGAAARGARTAQIFLGDPQGWKAPTVLSPGGAPALREAAEAAGVVLYVHAPYVINVATANNRIRIPSRKLLQQTLDLAAQVGAAGVVVHGGHVTGDTAPEAGRESWRKAVERTERPVPLLVENTAGGAGAMARTPEDWAALWKAAAHDAPENLGVCLDLCHAFAAGWDLAAAPATLRAITGRVDLVHANSSQDPHGSSRDRHANLAAGTIPLTDVVAAVASAGCDVVVETPGGTQGQRADVALLREALA